jgi:aldose 1-epimerase
MIALKSNGYELVLKPEVGASIGRFSYAGVPVLRTVSAAVAHAADSCCYPLVPFANRIENGLLRFGGEEIRLPPNMGDHPHPLHGHGWLENWRIASCSASAVVLAFDHARDTWPWAYTAEQSFSLGEDGLKIRLSVRNRADKPMPVSLGLHPFFPRRPGTVLTASIDGVWLGDATTIPTARVAPARVLDLPGGVALKGAPFVDNCFTGWDGKARIDQPDLGIALTMQASPACGFLHCYLPEGADFFAAEPVSAMPNSFNRPEEPAATGAQSLPPGERFAIEMRLAAERL